MKMTTHPRAADIKERWYLLDASGTLVGRLASQVALLLRGKHLPSFTPSVDPQTHCVVINASDVVLSGRKGDQEHFYAHTTRPGSLREDRVGRILEEEPEKVIRRAVKRMLPNNKLGNKMFSKHLKVYAGSEHPHQAQQPMQVDLDEKGHIEYPLPTADEAQ